MKRKAEKSEPAAEKELALPLAELGPLLEKKEKEVFAPFVDEGFGLCLETVSALEAVAGTTKALEGAKPEGQWSKIGEEMKKNFVERLPSALALKAPREKNYEALAAFRADAFKAISAAAKIISDNRYLAHFFPRQMSEFSRRANAASELNEKLAKTLRDGREAAAGVAAARKAIEKHGALEKEKILLEKDLPQLPVSGVPAAERKEQKPAGAGPAEKQIGEIDARISSARAVLATALNPLERPLRKLEKTSQDKKTASLAAAFASGAVAAALEKGLGEARFLAGELEKELAAGRVESDEKKRARLAAHVKGIDFEALEEKVRELRLLAEEKKSAEGQLRAEKAAERRLEEEASEAAKTGEKRRELAGKIAQKEAAIGESLREIADKAGGALGARIKILD